MPWAHPERWPLLLLAPVLGAWWLWAFRQRRRALEKFAAPPLAEALADQVDWAARRMKAALIVGGVLCLLLALVGPQWGFRWQEVRRRGVDLVIALDVSKSMLAEDVKPNRLERAKLAVQELVPLLRGDRIGLVAFAGTSFVQCPLTTDYGAFLLTLEELSPDVIPLGGTALGRAIRSGLDAFEPGRSTSQVPGAPPDRAQGASRVLVLITDGEDHEGQGVAAAKDAAKAGVTIFCVGIGTADGELIPIADDQGRPTFLKDREGRTVKSRLDETTLQRVAAETGGTSVRATPTAFGLEALYRERIATFTPHETERSLVKRFEPRFQWPLGLAFLLFALEPLWSDRRRAGGGATPQ